MTDTGMNEVRLLLERQAAWQKRRAALTWAEKVRMAEAVRESAAQFSRSHRPGPATQGSSPRPGTRSWR
jgi:hypothetical protein